MSEHTPTPWFHRQAGDVSRNGDHYDWIADHPGRGQHQKIIVARDSCLPEDFAFIVKAVNSHDALVKALTDTLCELTACADQLANRGMFIHEGNSVSRAQIAARRVLASIKELA